MSQMLDLQWDGNSPEFYCPACGKAVYQDNKTPRRCRHIIFSYIDSVGEVDYVAEGLERLEDAAADAEDPVGFLLKKLPKSGSTCCISITTHGIACGLVSETIKIAVDLNLKGT